MASTSKTPEILARLTGSAEHAVATLRALGVDHAEVSVGVGNELEVGVREEFPARSAPAGSKNESAGEVGHEIRETLRAPPGLD